jgi:hypothetical protein
MRTGGRGEEPPPLRFVGDWKKESLFVGARREKATASRCPSLDTANAASASILQRPFEGREGERDVGIHVHMGRGRSAWTKRLSIVVVGILIVG